MFNRSLSITHDWRSPVGNPVHKQPKAPSLRKKKVKAKKSVQELQEQGQDEHGKFLPRNLHGWKPGQSGNPAGRPKRKTLSEYLAEGLEAKCPLVTGDHTWGEVIVKSAMLQAAKGKPAAMQEVWNRSDGKVKDKIELEHKGPLVIDMTEDDDDEEED